MHQTMSIDKKTALTASTVALLVVCASMFFYTVFNSLLFPLFLQNELDSDAAFSLDASFDEAIQALVGREDLTVQAGFATLTQEGKEISAEVINGSSIPFVAKNLADKLKLVGVRVSAVGNSETKVTNTIVGLKERAFSYKEILVENIGTKSEEIKFETLSETYPYDIKIIIGR